MRRLFTLLALCAVAGSTTLVAQQHEMKRDSAMAPRMGADGGMMNHAMMMRMDSLGARLDSLTRVMNQASGTRKVNAMAEVVTALVTHHLEMQRHMHENMMGRGGMGGEHSSGKSEKRDSTPGGTPEHNH